MRVGSAEAFLSVAILCLIVLPTAAAQSASDDPASQPESTPAASSAPPDDTGSDATDASGSGDEEVEREATVPEEGEDASSDRIQYRDPLAIEYEPLKTKWQRFEDALLGITRYSFFDNQLRFRLGFRFQADGTLVAPSDQLEEGLGDMPDSADFRRLRLFAEGILRKMYFRVEFDFAADAGFKAAYLEGREGGLEIWGHLLGKFRYGLFQEPFSLENNLSTFDTAFVEISMPINTMGPGSNVGAMVYDASADRRFTWAAGAFSWGREANDNASTSLLSFTGRFGFQPMRYNDGQRMVHLGVSLSSRTPTSDRERYEARPEARFVRAFADTGDVPTNRNTLVALEAAWKADRSWAQAEWIRSNLDSIQANPHFDGMALQAGRFLTGDKARPWDDLFAVWGRVRPDQNYRRGNPFKPANSGIWEVAARFSMIDLNDGGIEGGVVRNLTAGLNWYPNTTTKIQFNWVHSRVEDQGYANIWVLRYQYAIK